MRIILNNDTDFGSNGRGSDSSSNSKDSCSNNGAEKSRAICLAWVAATAFLFLAMLLPGCSLTPKRTDGDSQTATPRVTPFVAVKTAPRVGLALGGGAARGFAHIGVIQVLEEAGIKPAVVVGTSAGSLVAALYASGKAGAELQHIAESMEEAALTDWTLPIFNRGVFRGGVGALRQWPTWQPIDRTIAAPPGHFGDRFAQW